MSKSVKIVERTKNSSRNILFAAISFVSRMVFKFIVRAIFVRYFIAGYLGLNGLFTNILDVLSLAELGVGNAIVYSMYKPIADNDTEKIKSLVSLYRNVYLVIAAVVTVIGLALIPALPYLIKDMPDVEINIAVVYVLYLAQVVTGYFFAYRRSLVFAYQRNDIESKVAFFTQILLSISQILIIILWTNYYAYVITFIVCTIIEGTFVLFNSYKLFPEIRGRAKKLEKNDTREIVKNTSAMVFHKLGGAVVFSTDSIIISAVVSTTLLGYYSNYTLITTTFASIVNLTITAVKGSIGNYIAQKTTDEVYKIYKSLNFAMNWFISFVFIGLIVCFQDFILLYTGKVDYILSNVTMILICISFYITQSRWLTNAFKECAGLFWNDRFKPLLEAGINLGLDLLLVYFMGINGVILATIISTIAAPLWVEPYVLYKHYFKKSVGNYFIRYFIYTLITLAIGCATYGVCYFIPTAGIGWFILKFAICLVLPNALFTLIYFKTPEFKYLLNVVKGLLKKSPNTDNQSDNSNDIPTNGIN